MLDAQLLSDIYYNMCSQLNKNSAFCLILYLYHSMSRFQKIIFNLSICKLGKQFCYRKPSDKEFNKQCHLYKYLNTLMLDEVSVSGLNI